VELRVKFAGYIRRQTQSVRQASRLEAAHLPDDFAYQSIGGLRTEARQALERVRPLTVGQASRIPGVSPADVAVLLIALRRHGVHATAG
ncbi:MAG TPA: tRNA uridine-5-carboxymethylaminomethyl(34) synthesis enzyme MnmG, partial [Ktedonobacterales bacterium]|nr:tRNA uridine-5-carboxymethylaminomethyl(34) synthesis enzyme MnmG [Ktedonobacterales bacterium]